MRWLSAWPAVLRSSSPMLVPTPPSSGRFRRRRSIVKRCSHASSACPRSTRRRCSAISIASSIPRCERSDNGRQAAGHQHPLPDAEARRPDALARNPHDFGRVSASLRRARRKPAARAYDALIAAIAMANDLPIYTVNPRDFAGIDDLLVVAIPHPDRT